MDSIQPSLNISIRIYNEVIYEYTIHPYVINLIYVHFCIFIDFFSPFIRFKKILILYTLKFIYKYTYNQMTVMSLRIHLMGRNLVLTQSYNYFIIKDRFYILF